MSAAIVFRILLAGLVLGAASLHAEPVLPVSAAHKKNLGITTVAVQPSMAAPALRYAARVSLPPASMRVAAAAGEALVTRVHVQAGDPIKRGAALVTLSMPSLAAAQSALTQARLSARLAAGIAARDEKLFAEGLIAESRVRASQGARQSAQAGVDAAQAAVSMLGNGRVRGSSITLLAPLAGIVMSTDAVPGQRVDAGTALVKLGDLSALNLEIPLSTQQARQVAVGQQFTVEGTQAQGRISALLPQLDASQSVLARASLQDPQRLLRPGQSVQIALSGTARSESLLVPAAALVWKVDVPYVFVETAQGFRPTRVERIRQGSDQVEITGLAAASRVAVKGVAALKAQWLGE